MSGMAAPFAPVQRTDWLEAPAELVLHEGGSVTTPPGYVAGAVACGLKPSGALDVGVLAATGPAVSAFVDTTNALPSAPVILNRTRDRARIRAVVVNAGNANAATGSPGLEDAAAMAARTAAALGIEAEEVMVCSTGTIGERLDTGRVLPAVDAAAAAPTAGGGGDFARAICTTDAFPKAGAFRLRLGAGAVTIGIASKGAGMIRPTMATMLAYVTTDACLTAGDLAEVTRYAAERAYNRISVDGQMSPSDTLLVMASAAGTPLAGADLELFRAALVAVCRWSAIQMVKDGEGAEHAVRVVVEGAADPVEAERVARAVGESSLVKTAIFGRDPNWGRISQAVGQALAGAAGPAAALQVRVDGVALDDPGVATVMQRAEYDIHIGLGRGAAGFALWASDLTHAYVTLNAEYHT